ncbi:MAG TPA: thiamine phosphate synthase [Candidatus Dormibacteraeota bacterium]|nr:thiamine phosphate synthase [Candidatus Dormibacteraeota bacterium]
MAIVASAEAGLQAASRATILQLRAPSLTAAQLEREANELVARSPVPVLISSRIDVALACGASGVNLPERDVATSDARKLVGDRLLGRSAHSLDAAVQAQAGGADYVIYGPVWQSASHPDVAPVGLESLERIAKALHVPVIAIGGLTEERIEQCRRAGAAGYAAIRMFA